MTQARNMNEPWYRPPVPRLDLGCGATPRDGYVGVDRTWRRPGIIGWNLADAPWPWADESIEALTSSHLIEHLPPLNRYGQDVLIRFFEEAWRICKPGALFHLRWPAPFDPRTGTALESAWWDPTHYRRIPHQQIVGYFSAIGRREMGVESYGIQCNWVETREVVCRTLTSDERVIEYDAELRRDPL